ncbi:MAG: F0F1 ATP synthase subunit B [Planctomycetaceae bacterium]|nr:F0F1 ATP synthase subunit B [Planctomycetaceae bacterium]
MRYLSTIIVAFSVCSLVCYLTEAKLTSVIMADEETSEEAPVTSEAEGTEEAGSETTTEGETTAKGETSEEAHHGDEGPPLTPNVDLVIFTLITFALFALILAKFGWTPLNEGLKAREIGIRENIAAAETARLEAEKMLADHKQQLAATQDQVKEIIAEAHRDADEVRQKLMAAAQRDVEALRQRTLEDLDRAKNQAVKELFDNVTEQVAMATEHVLGRALQAEDQNRLIDEALAQLPAKG